jgi:ligand-binding sensor domain-containing protein
MKKHWATVSCHCKNKKMKLDFPRFLICPILLLLSFSNIIRAQVNSSPKLITTQGSTQYDNVHCGLQDKAGNLWFGTTGDGVYRYDEKLFVHFTIHDGLTSNTIYSILEDKKGNIWFGSSEGLSRYDGKTISPIPMVLKNGNNLSPFTAAIHQPSQKNAVWRMFQDKKGTIWFGTSEGVYTYNGSFFSYFLDANGPKNQNGLKLNFIYAIVEDKSGNIWFGSGMREGISRYDGKSLTPLASKEFGRVNDAIEDKNGDILFASNNHGACLYDGKTLSYFTEQQGLDKHMNGILRDKGGNLWFTTDGDANYAGLWRYDGKSFTRFTTKDGLNSNSVFFMLEDKSGYLWFGTRSTGLSRFDGKKFTSFSE